MTYSQFTEDLRKEFHKRLAAKTNWGREQLKMEFELAMIEVLSKHMEKLTCDKGQ